MRVALAQVNPTVGDIAGNSTKILAFIEQAKKHAAHLVVFPELALIGYPPKDLLLKPQFVNDNLQTLEMIASKVTGIDVVLGYADRNPRPVGRPLHNAVAVLRDGRILAKYFKTLLPTYDVFDETRYFEPGDPATNNDLVRVAGVPIGLSVCEDLWNDERLIPRRLYHQNPIADLNRAGAKIAVNASASPFVEGKHAFRLQLFADQVKRFSTPLVYVNQVGGNDELVFDGNSVALDAEGNVIGQARDFQEDLLVVDLNSPTHTPADPINMPRIEIPSAGIESVYHALVLGLRDYVRKCGFTSAVLGLSGGIDSAVTCALAVAALGNDRVVGIAMPSRYSSDHSVADAKTLAKNLNIQFHLLPINSVHSAYENTLADLLNPNRLGDSLLGDDLTEQNLQARVRGALLMAFSNRHGHLLLTTGNKSEFATGYCTLYGDMCGGLAVISDVPKTDVYRLAQYINHAAGRELIPRNSITKPPSAELKPNQTDQDSLPPYELLDAILDRYVEQDLGAAQIVQQGFDETTVLRVIRMVDRSEYKRRQAAPGLKITSRAFGFGRRMPIAAKHESPFHPR